MGPPTGPMTKGTTYMVRPIIDPFIKSVMEWCICSGSALKSTLTLHSAFQSPRQLLVGPASFSLSLQIKVLSSTRATSPGSDRAKKELGLMAGFNLNNNLLFII